MYKRDAMNAIAIDRKIAQGISFDPLFAGHELLVEVARLELKLRQMPADEESVHDADAPALEERLQRVNHLLHRLAL